MGLDMYAYARVPDTFEPLPPNPFDARLKALGRTARWLYEIGVKQDAVSGHIHHWRKHYWFLQWLEELGTGETEDDWDEADRKAGREPQQRSYHFAISLTRDDIDRLEAAIINDELPNDGRCEAFHEGLLANIAGVIAAQFGPDVKLKPCYVPPAKLPPGAIPHGHDLTEINWRRDDGLEFVDKARRILVAGGKISIHCELVTDPTI